MKNKIISLACVAGLAAMTTMATGDAKANTSRTRTTAGATGWSDTGVTPSGTVLTANVIIAGASSALNVGPATSGLFNSRLRTVCPEGVIDEEKRNNTGDTAGDIIHQCFFGLLAPVSATGTIDDL